MAGLKKKRPIDLLKEFFHKYDISELNFSFSGKVLVLNHIIRTSNFDYYKIIYNIEEEIVRLKLTEHNLELYLDDYNRLSYRENDPEFYEMQNDLRLNRKIINLADERVRVLTNKITSIRKDNNYIFSQHNKLNWFDFYAK
jgi:hypothetical protein